MRTRRWIIGLIVLCAFLGVIAEEVSETINHCDLKKKETVLKCAKCNKLLTLFTYPKCDGSPQITHIVGGKITIANRIEIEENKTTTILAKCPKCGEKIVPETWIGHNKRCEFCHKEIPQQLRFCVKQVYVCPKHSTFESLKSGRCSEVITDAKGKEKKCGKKLELNRTVYSPIIHVYECPKCKKRKDQAGKCEVCKKRLRKKKTCKDSGTFPHVNEKEWKKQHQD